MAENIPDLVNDILTAASLENPQLDKLKGDHAQINLKLLKTNY